MRILSFFKNLDERLESIFRRHSAWGQVKHSSFEDRKEETLKAVALRAIQMTNPESLTLENILEYSESDDHLSQMMEHHNLSREDLEKYIIENQEMLATDNYLTRDGMYQPAILKL